MELAFSEWIKEQEVNEGIFSKTADRLSELSDKLLGLIPVIVKYAPYAIEQFNKDPDLKTIAENKSLLASLYYAMNRVGNPDFIEKEMQEVESVKKRLLDPSIDVRNRTQILKEFAQIEARIRESLITPWRMVVWVLDKFHITPIITEAIPQFGEFLRCLKEYQFSLDAEQKVKALSCAKEYFLKFLHQLISTSMFSGIAAKIVLILGQSLGSILLLKTGGVLSAIVLFVWVLLIILGWAKEKVSSWAIQKLIGKIIYFFSPAEHKKRPPIF